MSEYSRSHDDFTRSPPDEPSSPASTSASPEIGASYPPVHPPLCVRRFATSESRRTQLYGHFGSDSIRLRNRLEVYEPDISDYAYQQPSQTSGDPLATSAVEAGRSLRSPDPLRQTEPLEKDGSVTDWDPSLWLEDEFCGPDETTDGDLDTQRGCPSVVDDPAGDEAQFPELGEREAVQTTRRPTTHSWSLQPGRSQRLTLSVDRQSSKPDSSPCTVASRTPKMMIARKRKDEHSDPESKRRLTFAQITELCSYEHTIPRRKLWGKYHGTTTCKFCGYSLDPSSLPEESLVDCVNGEWKHGPEFKVDVPGPRKYKWESRPHVLLRDVSGFISCQNKGCTLRFPETTLFWIPPGSSGSKKQRSMDSSGQ
ncbi:hypothetical protein IAT40_000839 [Kwoniella sp. CBS 6097]